jgi:hypothetical protein
MQIINGVKRQLHRDIVSDPFLHARVLNLYLNGESYPHWVSVYFPVAHIESPELAAKMRQHIADEDKHIALYRAAIEKMGQPIIEDLPHSFIFNAVVRHYTPVSWAIYDHHDTDSKRLKLAHFLAHAHCLEKRVARSLEYHLDACEQSAHSTYVAKAVAAVLADECRHITYTAEAIFDVLPRATAQNVLRLHQLAEQQGNLDFSAAQLKRLLREHHDVWPTSHRYLYRFCAAAMRGVLFFNN